jgi:hypothetical protein
MANPNIQIDDLVREMTDEEFAAYQEQIASLPASRDSE